MLETKVVESREEWEGWLATREEASFLQSWEWGVFQENIDHPIRRIGFYRAEELIGVMLTVVEPAKRGRYLTVPGGPIIDWENAALAELAVMEMKKIAREEKCVFVRVRPQIEETNLNKIMFFKLGFRKAPIHMHAELTHRLDLTKSTEELQREMRKATRYEIRRAQKLGVEIKKTTEKEAMERFYQIQLETAKRQGFTPFGEKFLAEQLATFAAVGAATLYEAWYEGKYLAGAMIVSYGAEAVYHYGVSTEAGRKVSGAHLIQWTAIQEAKAQGKVIYNFWGVAPEEEREHRFAGLSLFKRGFGGEDFAYLHAQDLAMRKAKYLVVNMFEKWRKRARRV
ncbi:peptidoglycan bridge formation glycyltransferase FemA/FemB family protein [Microgenomates group bacterium]|nr:peptidoglycan bridge formation glycyltransferase FemA/FemB family protein [Microgenomates group bacterium]